MIRRFGEPRKQDIRYRHRPGAYVILPSGGDLLLTRQEGEESELQLPGGGIDPGESPVQALHREVLEETGWRIGRPRHLVTYRRFAWLPDYKFWAEKLCHIYVASPVRPHGPPSEPGHEALWMNAREATRTLTNEGDAFAVTQWVQAGAHPPR